MISLQLSAMKYLITCIAYSKIEKLSTNNEGETVLQLTQLTFIELIKTFYIETIQYLIAHF